MRQLSYQVKSRGSPGYLQNINRAHTAGDQIQDRHGNQLPIQPVALMPGAQFPFCGVAACRGPLEAGAQEALEVFDFPFREIFFMDLGLIFDEEVESVQHELHPDSWLCPC